MLAFERFYRGKEIFSKSSKLMCTPIVSLIIKHFDLNLMAEKQNYVYLIKCKYHFGASLIYKCDLEGRSKQDIHNAHSTRSHTERSLTQEACRRVP